MKTRFNVELTEKATPLCKELVALAAQANGGMKISLNEIYIVASGNKLQYPVTNDDIEITLITEDVLHVDRKVGEQYHTVCRIERVEIAKLASIDDLQGVLEPYTDSEKKFGAGC